MYSHTHSSNNFFRLCAGENEGWIYGIRKYHTFDLHTLDVEANEEVCTNCISHHTSVALNPEVLVVNKNEGTPGVIIIVLLLW